MFVFVKQTKRKRPMALQTCSFNAKTFETYNIYSISNIYKKKKIKKKNNITAIKISEDQLSIPVVAKRVQLC